MDVALKNQSSTSCSDIPDDYLHPRISYARVSYSFLDTEWIVRRIAVIQDRFIPHTYVHQNDVGYFSTRQSYYIATKSYSDTRNAWGQCDGKR